MEMNALLFSILVWMSGLPTGYKVPDAPPRIVFVERAELCRLFVRKSPEEMTPQDIKRCQVSRVGAVYVEFEIGKPELLDTVYLPTDFDPKDLFQQSQLAHEVGHYVQRVNGVFALLRRGEITVGAIEGEGHQFQKMWFHTRGSDDAQQAIFAAVSGSGSPTALSKVNQPPATAE